MYLPRLSAKIVWKSVLLEILCKGCNNEPGPYHESALETLNAEGPD